MKGPPLSEALPLGAEGALSELSTFRAFGIVDTISATSTFSEFGSDSNSAGGFARFGQGLRAPVRSHLLRVEELKDPFSGGDARLE